MGFLKKLFHKEDRNVEEEEKKPGEVEEQPEKTETPETQEPAQEPTQEPAPEPAQAEEPKPEEKTDPVAETLLNLSNKMDKLISLMECKQSEPEQQEPGEKGLTPADPNKTAGENKPKPYLDQYRG